MKVGRETWPVFLYLQIVELNQLLLDFVSLIVPGKLPGFLGQQGADKNIITIHYRQLHLAKTFSAFQVVDLSWSHSLSLLGFDRGNGHEQAISRIQRGDSFFEAI